MSKQLTNNCESEFLHMDVSAFLIYFLVLEPV